MIAAMPTEMTPSALVPPLSAISARARVLAGLFALLVVALGLLVIAFAASARHAERQFARASLSEQQAAAVAQIAFLARRAGHASPAQAEALDAAARGYRNLIIAETASEDGAGRPAQSAERRDAERLEQLARGAAGTPVIQDLATKIAAREAAEVVEARHALAAAGRRSLTIAALLAVVALASALCGAWLLWRANRALEALVEVRTARIAAVDSSRRLFFAKASHELRTPVAGLRSAAEVALEQPDLPAPVLRESLAHVVAGAAFLSHRIDELLGLARAEDGQLQLANEPFDLHRAVADAVAEARRYAASVDVTIVMVAPDQPAVVRGDARWLRQALLAVMENGLKFSPEGTALSVALSITPEQRATIVIADRGPGVMDADLPRIFDAYYQSDAGRSRGGSGLGLALARWVVEQHGGMITARNLEGGGCAIDISLPVEHRA